MIEKAKFRLVLGALGFIVALVCGILSGFSWYNPDATIVTATLITTGSLLSVGIVKHFKNNKNE